MVTTYRLHVDELSPAILQSIQSTFKNKTVEIIVTEATDETNYLLSNDANREGLFESLDELNRGGGTTLTVQEFLVKYGNGQ